MTASCRSFRSLVPVGSAIDLAVLRITVAALLSTSASARVAEAWGALPPAARVAPVGVGWLLPHLAITPDLVRMARIVMIASAFSAAVGLWSRTSLTLLAISGAYVLLIPQLGGVVFHDHHLLWLVALLAASPAGDALSLDAFLARRRGTPRARHGKAHGAAIRCAWLILACVFFFPGAHKLGTSGLEWILGDTLRNHLAWKWAMDPTLVPAFRIDRHPGLLHACAALTIGFELAFPLLLVRATTRALAVVLALAFHAATDHFMGIDFSVLYACYTVFVPWEALASRIGFRAARVEATPATPCGDDMALFRVGIVGALLALGIGTAGVRGETQGYPFACYPTFATDPGSTMPAIALELVHADGTRERVDRSAWREEGPRGWALEWSLAGAYDGVDPARIEVYFRDVFARPRLRSRARRGDQVLVYGVRRSVDPDHPRAETSRRLLHAFALGDR